MRWAGHLARTGKEEMCIQRFGGESCGKGTTWNTPAYMGG